MNEKVALWIAGAAILPLIGWCISMSWLITSTHKMMCDLIKRHTHPNPDVHGFGTIGANKLLEENTRCLKQLTHYIVWFVEKQTKESPPPFVDDDTWDSDP